MKALLMVMAIVEGLTGIGLLVAPSLVSSMLLGTGMSSLTGLVVGRIAGAAILALAIACWASGKGEHRITSTYIVPAMLFYNIAAALVLAYAIIGLDLQGFMLLPAIAAHLILGIWCTIVLRSTTGKSGGP